MAKRTEHPNPMKKHNSYICLNGTWEFEYDNTLCGKEKEFFRRESLNDKIEVPFCPESKLSGHGNTDFINAVWYRRDIEIAREDLSGHVLITFGAVDYESELYINGDFIGGHTGGYTPFTFDITEKLHEGKNSVCLYAKDDMRYGLPRGKQSSKLYSNNCDYTRVTGIWQTVYLEILPECYAEGVKLTPDIYNTAVEAEISTVGKAAGKIEVFYEGKKVGEESFASNTGIVHRTVKLSELHLWEPDCGRLYDVKVSYGDDVLESYFGMRSVRLEDKKFLINDKSFFQRFVLDQGYYQNGIYTAETLEELESDILLSRSFGFNGARLHMKIFEPMFLYYCDKHGYPVWDEFPSWNCDFGDHETLAIILPQWLEQMARDYNHPSIIGWCPLNETSVDFYGKSIPTHDSIIRDIYFTTKALDKTRPCIDVSGYIHQYFTDIYDIHEYDQNPDDLRRHCEILAGGTEPDREINFTKTWRRIYHGQPLFVSEFGGALWAENSQSWGYGENPKTEEEFLERFNGLCSAIMDNPSFFGFCYTQLYDIEQEQNGLAYYNRTPKFAPEKFKALLDRPAAIEKD